MNSRRAHTLIELTVTMSVGSALMVLTVGFIHQAMSLSSTARARTDQHRTMDRLSKDFRHDVHLAREVAITDEQDLELSLEDGTVATYIVKSGQIRRELRGDTPIIAREEYKLPSAMTVQFDTTDRPRLVSISFDTAPVALRREGEGREGEGREGEGRESNAEQAPSEEVQTVRRISAALGRTLTHQTAEVEP